VTKPGAISDLKALLAGMAPRLNDRAWVFAPIEAGAPIAEAAFAIIREDEGLCAVLPAAKEAEPRFACITLEVHSDLEAVGLTAAVSVALADAGIACNVIAGLHHDHLFVPWERRETAIEQLQRLSAGAR